MTLQERDVIHSAQKMIQRGKIGTGEFIMRNNLHNGTGNERCKEIQFYVDYNILPGLYFVILFVAYISK
jgi:hypothetical protein